MRLIDALATLGWPHETIRPASGMRYQFPSDNAVGYRIAALAMADEVLVTSTVRELVVGSGIEFSDRGSGVLKGVPGTCRLLAVAKDPSSLSGSASSQGV